MSNPRQIQVHGTVAPGFEPVRDLYELKMKSLQEQSTQLCVYHKGERVVDLWATGNQTFMPDTLVNVYSSGKSLEAIALASLVDQGLLQYEAPIASYWPAFGAQGKENVTVQILCGTKRGWPPSPSVWIQKTC